MDGILGWCYADIKSEIISKSGNFFLEGVTVRSAGNPRLSLIEDWYSPQTFISGLYIRPTNSFVKDGNLEYYPADESKPDKFVPSISGYAGGNWFDEKRKLLYVVVKGSEPYKIVTVPIIKVG